MDSVRMARNTQSSSGSNPGPLARWARQKLLARLRGLSHGQIVLEEGSERQLFGTPDPQDPIDKWWIEVDLGRTMVVDQIVLKFVDEEPCIADLTEQVFHALESL